MAAGRGAAPGAAAAARRAAGAQRGGAGPEALRGALPSASRLAASPRGRMNRISAGALAALAVGAVVAGAGCVRAMPPRPESTLFALEGGCEVRLQLRGDAFTKYWEREDGVTLCKRGAGFVFVDEEGLCSDELLSCDEMAGAALRAEPRPAGRRPKAQVDVAMTQDTSGVTGVAPTYASQQLRRLPERMARLGDGEKRRALARTPKVLSNLVLMVRFADHVGTKKLPSKEDYEVLFNSLEDDPERCPSGSLRKYYMEQSYGALQINSTVSGWIDVTYTEAQAAGPANIMCQGVCGSAGLQNAIREGIRLFEAQNPDLFRSFDMDNDGEVDMFTVIHSGYGAETGSANAGADTWIWSHRFDFGAVWFAPLTKLRFFSYNVNPGLWGDSGSGITHLGVLAHEAAHYLGLPDFYDVDDSSYGLGLYDIMANSWGYDRSQYYPGSFSAPAKHVLGWLEPMLIAGGSGAEGEFSMRGTQAYGDTYLLPLTQGEGTVEEVLASETLQAVLVEYREATKWDQFLTGGMLLWHLDMAKLSVSFLGARELNPQANAFELKPYLRDRWIKEHYAVRLIQADNRHDLERKVNEMDEGDWWRTSDQVAGDDEIFPNLQTYELAALGVRSGHYLRDFSINSDGTASFSYAYELKSGVIQLPEPPAGGIALSQDLDLWVWGALGAAGMLVAIAVIAVTVRTVQRMRGPNAPLDKREDEYLSRKPVSAAPRAIITSDGVRHIRRPSERPTSVSVGLPLPATLRGRGDSGSTDDDRDEPERAKSVCKSGRAKSVLKSERAKSVRKSERAKSVRNSMHASAAEAEPPSSDSDSDECPEL